MQLPVNLEVENAVLGSILLDSAVVYLAIHKLRPDYFFDERNKQICAAILELARESKPIDFLTVLERLKEHGSKIDQEYLFDLTKKTPSTLHIEYYADMVAKYFRLRELVIASTKLANAASAGNPYEVDTLLDEFSSVLYATMRADQREAKDSKFLMNEFWDNFEKRFSGYGKSEVSTGFVEIDSIVGGFNKGDLVVIAGRTSLGKTSLMMSCLLKLGLAKIPCVLFPYEMTRAQTSQRLVSMLSGVPLIKVRTTTGITQEEMDKIVKAVSDLSMLPIYIDDNPFGDVFYLASAIRQHVMQKNIRVAAVDYIQAMPTASDDLVMELGKISKTLKSLAVSLDISIIEVSQLNRAVESRSDNKPRLSDLRQSGRIEEDADIVIGIERDRDAIPEDATAHILKNRNGPTGSISLMFDTESTRFIGKEG